MKILSGSWVKKNIVILSDYVVSYYDKSESIYLENIKKNIDYICYPYAKFYEIDLSNNYTITKRVYGESRSGQKAIIEAAKQILIHNKIASKIILDCRDSGDIEIHGIVSHGDLSLDNIIWIDNQIVLIDFDSIHIYPMLYDFFRLIFRELGQIGLEMYIIGYFDKYISDLFISFNIEFNEKIKDIYLSLFYKLTFRNWKTDWFSLKLIPKDWKYSMIVFVVLF
jgi:hypothetical protein